MGADERRRQFNENGLVGERLVMGIPLDKLRRTIEGVAARDPEENPLSVDGIG